MVKINSWGSDDPAEETKGGTGTATFSTGDVLYSDSSNSLAKLGIGSTDDVLVVTAGVPAWSTVAAAGANDWTLISTTSPTSGSAVQIASGIGTAYEDFMFVFNALTASTTAILDLGLSIDAGSNYNKSIRGHRWEQDTSTTPITGFGVADIDLAQTGTSGGYNGYIHISGNKTPFASKIEVCVQGDSPADSYFYFGSAPWTPTTGPLGGGDIDAVEFTVSAGTFASGNIYLYGR